MLDTSLAKLLLVTCHRWPNPPLMAHALVQAGWSVGMLGPWRQPARLMTGLDHLATHDPWDREAGLRRAFAAWQPDLLVPCDDSAAAMLHGYRARLGAEGDALARCIARSLGGEAHTEAVLHKSRFIEYAGALGLRVPASVTLAATADLPAALAAVGLPCMVKRDESWGGAGVAQAATAAEAAAALARFRAAPGWAQVWRAAVVQQDAGLLRQRLRFRPPGLALQAMVPGSAVNRAVLCWQGRVLAGLTIEALENLPDCGPTSVVREIGHAGIAAASARMVAALGLSGFVGFDFMLDAAGDAHLIELNPRVTPACTLLVRRGAAVAAALRAAMAGAPLPAPAPDLPDPAPHVLFPQELQRDPRSGWLDRREHRVPWDEPRLVSWCIGNALRRGQQARRGAARA